MRLDEREIPGASERIEDAPTLIEVRRSGRGRVPKREWSAVDASKPRKKRRVATPPLPLRTLTSTKTTTQNSTQSSTASFAVYEDKLLPDSSQSTSHSTRRTKQKQQWEVEYDKLKKRSTQDARDYLVQLIGNEEYPEALKVPIVPPTVLLDIPFTLDNPLSI